MEISDYFSGSRKKFRGEIGDFHKNGRAKWIREYGASPGRPHGEDKVHFSCGRGDVP
jgi:hypothetical protein